MGAPNMVTDPRIQRLENLADILRTITDQTDAIREAIESGHPPTKLVMAAISAIEIQCKTLRAEVIRDTRAMGAGVKADGKPDMRFNAHRRGTGRVDLRFSHHNGE